MILNWTIEVILYFIAAGLVSAAAGILVYHFVKKRERHVLCLMIAYLFATAFLIQEGLSYLFLFMPFLAYAPLYAFVGGYFLILGIDSISRESVDPAKMAIWTGLIATVVFFFFQPGSFGAHTFPNGDKSVTTTGIYQYVVNLYAFFPILLYIFYGIKINRLAPPQVKADSRLFLAGAIITTLWPGIFALTRLSLLIPGIHMIGIAFGSLLISIAFARQPKLAFILPFRALRLLVIDTEGGNPLFLHDWAREGKLADELLFSGMLQGIGKLLHHTLNQGEVQEIQLAHAVLILHRSDKYPVACVLLATNTSPSLRRALNGFAEAFYAQYAPYPVDSENNDHIQPAESLVTEWFGFVPVQE